MCPFSLVCNRVLGSAGLLEQGGLATFGREFQKRDTMTDKPKLQTDEDGSKIWKLDGLPHREDGPAVEQSDGSKYWFVHGLYHRTDGPALDESDGTKHWYLKGKHHREDGPAIERSDGSKEWWQVHQRHREDGPAVVFASGRTQYWLRDTKVEKDTVMKDELRTLWLSKHAK